MQWENRRRKAWGFSLVELMVVVLIMGLLATVVTVSVRDYLSKGKQTTARTEISQIGSALELFHAEYGHYPSNEEGLAKLQERSTEHPTGILQGDLLDPWNRPYIYIQPGLHGPYDILCYGGDGQEGGEGDDADIVSWNLSGAGED
jgi:general secretion pathway protein G